MRIEWSLFVITLIPFTQGSFVPNEGWNGPSNSEKEDFSFKNRQCIFAISILSPLGKDRGVQFEQTVNSHHSRMLCAKFCWNQTNGFWEDYFSNFVNELFVSSFISPLKKGRSPLFEQYLIQSSEEESKFIGYFHDESSMHQSLGVTWEFQL